jgi:hypothetical protein
MVSESDAIDMLIGAGFSVEVPQSGDRSVDLCATRDGQTTCLQVKVRQKSIYEWDARQILETAHGRVLVVVPVASRGLIDAAKRDSRLSVASVRDRRLIWDREEIQSPNASWNEQLTVSVPSRRRNPWGRWALMRALLLDDEPRTQVALAKEIAVTQSGVSKAMSALDAFVTRSAGGWSASDRSRLWDAFMAEYPGPGGFTSYWYGLDPIIEQSKAVAVAGVAAGIPVLRSGDPAADELAPWRVPSRAVVYAKASIGLEKLGFARTSAERATLQFTVPADQTIWATAGNWADQSNTTTVDPVLAAWDLKRIGGPDAPDAIDRVRKMVIPDRRL